MKVDRKHLSTRERVQCFEDGDGNCHMCGLRILAGTPWDVSHVIPLAAGGTDTRENRRPAHRKCHRDWTAAVDAPLIAKTKRRYAQNIGAKAPPRNPMPGSRASKWKHKMNGQVERRT